MKTPPYDTPTFCRISPLVLLAAMLLLLVGSSCSSIQTRDMSSVRTVDISSHGEELAQLETFFQGEKLTEPLIIAAPAGFRMPVHFSFNTPIAEMAGDCGDLVFNRAVYLYLGEQMMLVSPDKSRWASIGDHDGIKELFGVGSGEIKIGMGADKVSGPLLEIGITAHPAAPEKQ